MKGLLRKGQQWHVATTIGRQPQHAAVQYQAGKAGWAEANSFKHAYCRAPKAHQTQCAKVHQSPGLNSDWPIIDCSSIFCLSNMAQAKFLRFPINPLPTAWHCTYCVHRDCSTPPVRDSIKEQRPTCKSTSEETLQQQIAEAMLPGTLALV